ncbi:hypothetical protein HGO97_012610 [Faecalicatena sp. AGMB00832]|uniref:Sensory rhodopsin transducer n=1 Tax=Faecalicatena faecalis TaxID=2726362 RepID=A0ABS6D586_9FIRM|nr:MULTISPECIES: sensory rhodopsin transducer [Faecalicatena]MBU3876646.1 hypothetical protein [Faecalicatena faecalis]MCI6464701.1 sensory rhodopsin transducer [Faecalicatena sp.]MDY5618279.1 sensory rhodopsin transducer [Lachnospiraceae bacterium]
MEIGKKTWVFADGDLPPRGEEEPFGHEALMVVNSGEKDAKIRLDLLFDSKDPKEGILLHVPAKRVICFRMDEPLGEEQYQIGPGQFAVVLNSNVPVVAVYGRLDRRKDMAYYPVAGYSV